MPKVDYISWVIGFVIWVLCTLWLHKQLKFRLNERLPQVGHWKLVALGGLFQFVVFYGVKGLPSSWILSFYDALRSYFTFSWLPYIPYEKSEGIAQTQELMALISLLAIFLVMDPFITLRKIDLKGSLLQRRSYFILIAWVLGSYSLSYWLANMTLWMDTWPQMREVQELPKNHLPLLVWMMRSFIFLPLIEEVLFRRWLLGWLGQWLPSFLAWILSSIAFSLAHGLPGYHQPYPLSLTFFGLGLWFGLTYCKSQSLLLVWLVHSLYNALTWLKTCYPGT